MVAVAVVVVMVAEVFAGVVAAEVVVVVVGLVFAGQVAAVGPVASVETSFCAGSLPC